ncbi:DUF1499 domain-containing protein [Crocosphaera sp. UHCC 0190]|uniref:DUF1499 domain-containing protein n=1 Tax=Crocosphaera sp. UHCC 0190 TaxID=3110246 RepID=UPI002B219D5E|nr:DUF1499 domain-containing protein [Crocosphaera sp. UHCC 0190]MEA5511759.1 DUF1499 domain-containing protein [Crocosphaera sp. UHCC 0190]
MSRHFWSIIIVGLLSFFLTNSVAYGTELIENNGLREGHLLPCPSGVSCVVSDSQESKSYIAPIPYHTDSNHAREILLKVLTVVPRTKVVQTTDNYIRAESTGKIFGGIDELEFYFPPNQPLIQLRSASRNSQFDLGLNRRRLEQIRLALRELNI